MIVEGKVQEKKEEIWLSPMTILSPYTNRNVKGAKRQHKQRHKNRLQSGYGPTLDGQLE